MAGKIRIGQMLGRIPASRQGLAGTCQRTATQAVRGFTLIEMVVVIGVVAIISVIAIPAFSTMHEHQAVNNATNSLLAHLKQARVIAMSENRSVSITFSSTGYTYDADTTTGGTCGLCKPDTLTYSDLSSNLTATLNPTTTKTITFTSRGTANTATIKMAIGSYSHSISVNIIGRAYEQ